MRLNGQNEDKGFAGPVTLIVAAVVVCWLASSERLGFHGEVTEATPEIRLMMYVLAGILVIMGVVQLCRRA